ncbi:MAG: hypothetical protein PVH61_44285 [Candidatus Aminicenantes bacterium]|jgi:hypothetical protein
MNEKKLVENFENRFSKFEEFWEKGVYWSGVAILSSIYNCITKDNVSLKTRNEWMEKISKYEISQKALDSIQNEFVNYYERLKRIMSIGSKFNDDEFLFLIVYHTQLYLVREYLKAKDIELPNLDLDEIEEQIKELGNLKQNKKDFLSAINQMKRNSPIPVDIVWMRDVVYK